MKLIDIQLNQAKILSYSVTNLEGDKPDISATIGLFHGNKKLAEFTLHTQNWYSSGLKFDISPDLIMPIVDISKELEIILVRKCNEELKRLPEHIDVEKINEG